MGVRTGKRWRSRRVSLAKCSPGDVKPVGASEPAPGADSWRSADSKCKLSAPSPSDRAMNKVHDRLRTALKDRYTVEQEIGRGGMAYVFLADDLKHHRKVALKVLRPELAASVGPERFLREIEIEASLQHPHILALYDSGEADGLLYYSMPYVEGENLRERLRREKQMELDQALNIAEQISDAVAYAHSHNVVHRDLKPENILLTNGHALVADFGVARALSAAADEQLTDSGFAVGTPTYMSPEQALGSSDLDYRSDVYSLGLVVYEMLAGEPPFSGPTPVAVLARHANERVPSLEIVRPNVPSGVVAVIEKALEKVPADRYQTADDFGKALHKGVSSEVRVVRLSVRRRRWQMFAGVASAVVAITIGLWLFFFRPGPLNPDWVMVFPLDVSGEVGPAEAGLGIDNAYLIWNALDGRSSLRWINAVDLVEDPEELTRMSARGRRAFSRSEGAGIYLFGRTLQEGDTWHTYLTLHDVAGDSVVARADTAGRRADARILGVEAVGELLLEFLPEETVDVSAIAGRDAEAVQAFVQAERHFHAGRFDKAFQDYSEAVNLDSSFTLAAIKAAQAASWRHDVGMARALIAVALEHAPTLSEKHLHFARGWEAFLNADADTAVYHFEQAISFDENWAESWTGLGEVYTHLLPRKTPQDSLAKHAFEQVYLNTEGSAPALFHLFEHAVAEHELTRASELLTRYRAASPDTSGYALKKLELMMRCAEAGPEGIDWQAEMIEDVTAVGQAARALGVGGAYPGCATEAWRALREPTQSDIAWRFAAMTGLMGMLASTGQSEELAVLVDTMSEFDGTPQYQSIVLALAGADVDELADSVADAARQELFELSDWQLWFLGVWDAYHGNVEEARVIRDTLLARVPQTGRSRTDHVAREMSAHVALAEGDTTRAIQLLRALKPYGRRSNLENPWGSLGLERLTLARLLLAKGRYDEAYRVATSFDSPGASNIVNTVFLRASLEIRLEAARALGNKRSELELERRAELLKRVN